MKRGPLITAAVTLLAMGGVMAAFVSNASPYVTVAQAKQIQSDRLHLAGDIIKGSVSTNLKDHTLSFRIKDKDGQEITILHRGDPPANMGSATQVVAIGGMQGERFVSEQLLLKCPSKYEGQKKDARGLPVR